MVKTIRLENPNTEVMKIRQYVVDLIYRGGSEPQKVPSARKLAEMFGVSHPTALKALQKLAEGGYLLACGTNGYLTVPSSLTSWGAVKVIGILSGDGCNVLFSRQYVAESSPVLEAILGRSGSLSAQYIYLQGTPENAVTIIRNYNLDGLIWFSPDPKYGETIRILRESGLPIVEVGFVTGNASCARWNFVEDHYRIMNQILKEGRRHPLILSTNCPQDLYSAILAGFRRSCEENNFPLEQSIFLNDDPDSVMRQVSQLLNYGLSFDAVLMTGNCCWYWDFLKDHFDVKNKCRVFGGELVLFSDMKFTGCAVRRKMKEAAVILAENFFRQMESPSDAPVSVTDIETEFVLYEDGCPVQNQTIPGKEKEQ